MNGKKIFEMEDVMSDFWGSLAMGAGGVVGSFLGYDSAEKTRLQEQAIFNANYQQQEKWNQNNYDLMVKQQNLEAANAEKNFGLQQANLDWQKAMQKETWDREDNATQRRAADLIKAGMSPVLAAGGAAASSAPVGTTAPYMESPTTVPRREPTQMKYDYSANLQKAQMLNAIGQSTGELALRSIEIKKQNEQLKLLQNERRIAEGTEKEKIERERLLNATEILKQIKLTNENELARLEKSLKSQEIKVGSEAEEARKKLGLPPGVKSLSAEHVILIAQNKNMPLSQKLLLIGVAFGSAVKDTAEKIIRMIPGVK